MRKSFIVILVTACAGFTLPSAQLMATVIPPNLPPGSQYQLIFVTADSRDATSSDIADYNAFVTNEAALNPLLPSTTWHVVGSTATVNANVNAPSAGLPIYNTQGIEVASSATGLYTPNLLSPIRFDQYGFTSLGSSLWTGNDYTGTASSGPLGSSLPFYGAQHETNSEWAYHFDHPSDLLLPFYALSDPLTVPVPEPSSAVIFVLGIVGLIEVRRRLRKKC